MNKFKKKSKITVRHKEQIRQKIIRTKVDTENIYLISFNLQYQKIYDFLY
jgi:hypothetical protein